MGATEIQEDSSVVLDYKDNRQQAAIQDIDDKIDKMIDSIIPSNPYHRYVRVAPPPPFFSGETLTLSGINIKESNVTSVVPLFLGSNTFINDTGVVQTHSTSVFSEAITKTQTTATTLGGKLSTSAKMKVGVPLIEGEIQTTLEFNYSNTDTNSESKTITITAPSQSVNVPANKIYKSEVYFEKKSTSGSVELHGDVYTHVGVIGEGGTHTIGHVLDLATSKEGLVRSPINPNEVRVNGKGNFTVEHGSNLIVRTYDITSGERSAQLVNTEIIPLK
ncbi:ETX/MTX2 family pore-forming toxin [Lysinibacillus fusiformis]